jgi:thiol-disulfide isomerase/thioredoxin
MNVLIISLLITIVALLVWRLWEPFFGGGPKKELEPGQARIYFFYTDWCGWSQKAMPEWEKLEDAIRAKPYFGTTKVVAVRVDGDKDRETTELYDVEGYPIIKLESKDGVVEHKGKRTAEDLLNFLRASLGKESESL